MVLLLFTRFETYVLAAFRNARYHHEMTDRTPFRPATADEIATALFFMLQCNGWKHVRDAANVLARVTAERLARYLQQSGFVIMKAPPAVPPTTTAHTPSSTD